MTRGLDVLFVIPSVRTDGAYGPLKKDAIEPPAKARFMAAYLMRRGVSVDVIDANVTDDTPQDTAEKVRSLNPRLVWMPVYGFNPSSSTQTMPSARAFAQAVKNIAPETPIVMSGTHPAALPEKTLHEEPIDFVCGGEGPITAHELLQAIQGGEGVEKVRGLWRFVDGRVVHNAPAPLIDLNEEPALPGWKFMDPRNYRAHNWHTFYRDFDDRGPYANSYSAEGCPFHCDFCNIQSTYREGEQELVRIGKLKPNVNSYRFLRPELFVEELTFLREQYGVKYVKVPDEMFALNQRHVLEICRLVSERHGDWFDFWAYARVDTCKPAMLDPLRAAGFRWLALGIEAANSTVRSGQDKKFNDQTVHDVVARLHAAGIEGALNYIFGLPGDTPESLEATYKMAADLNGAFANFYCTQALPGSALYREAQKSGYPLPEREGGPGWIGHAQYSYETEPYYRGHSLTPQEVLSFRDKAHVAYYGRPEYRARLASDPKFGEVAVRTIDEWVRSVARIERRILEKGV